MSAMRMQARQRGGACVMLVILACPWVVRAQPTPPGKAPQGPVLPWKEVLATRDQAQKLGAQGQVEQAVALVGTFLRKHATPVAQVAKPANLGAIGMLSGVAATLLQGMPDDGAKAAQYQKIWADFADVPAYRVMAAASYVNHLLWKQQDPAAAEKFGREALEALGEELPPVYHAAVLPLNLGRANRFLEYQKTGQGENPLPTF